MVVSRSSSTCTCTCDASCTTVVDLRVRVVAGSILARFMTQINHLLPHEEKKAPFFTITWEQKIPRDPRPTGSSLLVWSRVRLYWTYIEGRVGLNPGLIFQTADPARAVRAPSEAAELWTTSISLIDRRIVLPDLRTEFLLERKTLPNIGTSHKGIA